ncbi:MAG: hypothetical protein ACFFFG_09775 [Candidatus Thorarchaeota archaeon]
MEDVNQEVDLGEFVPEYLSSLEETVLEELSVREKNYSFRFNGLRRLLKDVHQQKLTKALERLLEDGYLERYPDGGYGLGRGNEAQIRKYFRKQDENYYDANLDSQRIYRAVSPDHRIPVQKLTRKLAGKYFGDYRFIGHYIANGKGRLEWLNADIHTRILITTIDSSQIEVRTDNIPSNDPNLKKLLSIIQQALLDDHIILSFRFVPTSSAN